MHDLLRRHREPLILALLCAAALLPFINKPFHIDDPITLWTAEQIRRAPLDFYGYSANWYGTDRPMHEMAKNPPLGSYFAALVMTIAGEREAALHAAYALLAITATLGTYFIARHVTPRPFLAAVATLAAPVFLLSAMTVMYDMIMLAFYVLAVWAWLEGMKRDRPALLWVAAVLIVLSTLSKYFGITLIPLLLAHGLLSKRRLGTWALPMLLPIALLAAYQIATQKLYGRGLLFDATSFTINRPFGERHPRGLVSLLIGLAFAGGCALPPVLMWLIAAPIRTAIILVAGIGATILLLLIFPWADESIRVENAITPAYLFQFAAFVGGGAALLAMCIRQVLRQRTPETITLALWLGGTFVFATLVNWNIAGRSLLPLAPPAAILASLAFPRASFKEWTAIILAGAITLWICFADQSLARSQRDAAHQIMSDPRVREAKTVHFAGHWGFQWYMQRLGAKPLDRDHWHIAAGDVVAFPTNNASPVYLPQDARKHELTVLRYDLPQGVSTMRWNFSGFYSDIWGPLPFAFGPMETERYHVAVLDEPLQSQP